MITKLPFYSGIILIFISLLLIYLSAVRQNITLLVIAILLLLVSIFFIFFITVLDLFKKDKILDIEALKRQGLHIVNCTKCNKDNVLEDQYCIYCGEKLEKKNE